jgi:nucleotide-binding universal stress UspA family protein
MAMPAQATAKIVTFDNILFATDFSKHSGTALPFALSIAHKYGSRIIAAHVIPPPPLGNFPTIEVQALAAQALREAHVHIKELGRRLGAVPHDEVLRKGDIWDELSAIAKEKKVDLIVLGTHGRTGVSKLLIGSVAERIFRQSKCPVLTVGPNVSGEPRSVADIHTILCPIDFTPESLAAFPYALSLAEENQARLYLMHVVPDPIVNYEEASLVSRLKALVPPEARLWCEPKAVVETGNAAERVLDQAEELGVDLIVLGIRPVSMLAGTRTHLGMATAYTIVSRAICPVLSVRG